MDARLGVQDVCTRVLPAHTRVPLRDGEAQMSQWLMGKSMVIIYIYIYILCDWVHFARSCGMNGARGNGGP